ncbi:hypothetical protein [Halococcus salsus]|nr:hypothetical protein [Halococcus salsus]
MSQEQFAANLDLVDCEECGTEFNLGGQSYFAPLCPDCKRKADNQQ